MRTIVDEIVTTYKDLTIEFDGLTLLSRDEYVRCCKNIKNIKYWWWLRSPGFHSDYAILVGHEGNLNYSNVSHTFGSVRPALIINQWSNLKIGTKFRFFGYSWTVVSEKYALCDDIFCKMPFRKDFKFYDANDYASSDVKNYLDSIWNGLRENYAKID